MSHTQVLTSSVSCMYPYTHAPVCVYPRAHQAVIGVLEADGDPIEKPSLTLLELLQCLQFLLTFPQEICQAVHLLVHLQCLNNIERNQIKVGSGTRHSVTPASPQPP